MSYGTGDNKIDTEDHVGEEAEAAGYNFVATSDSELEEEYSVYNQQHNSSLNWGSVREMENLPETKEKGGMMFTQRRTRTDAIVSGHEEHKGKGLTEPTEVQPFYDTNDMYVHTGNHLDENLSNVQRSLVPNRTAKPFLGFHSGTTSPVMPGGFAPMTKKPEPRFKVPVPITISPQVWSPTGDIIASRDERISVPAIKTGILPESKRKGAKQHSSLKQGSDPQLQNKGGGRSYVEAEEDCFSLGAEACNFMQPRTIKHKNPPPVAPKPAINPTCPPWMKDLSGQPYIPPRSPGSQRSQCPVGPHNQHCVQQQDWARPQEMMNCWAPDQAQATLQTPASSQLLQPTINSRSQQLPRSPVSMQTCSPTYSPHHPPSPSRNKSNSAQNSVASCPPKAGVLYVDATKPLHTMAGKGAELFARRQSRMEKFVVDRNTEKANKPRSSSPTPSLPHSWRYSPNVRAPPPLSYNPLLSPFHPPSAVKQAPSPSPSIKPKTKEKPKAAPKHLNALDIMKHQPYQLDSSLFKYDVIIEAKSPSPKPTPPSTKPTPPSKFEATKSLKHRFDPSHSSYNVFEPDLDTKSESPSKSPGLVSSNNSCAQQNNIAAEHLAIDKHLDEKHTATPAAHHVTKKQAPSIKPAITSPQQSSTDDSISSAFSPASLIARGTCQMAPRPKFSAKKPVVTSKQWRSVAMPI